MQESVIKDQLLNLLEGVNAHITFEKAIANIPIATINLKVPGIPYSLWELVEHMRLTQFDILDFIQNPHYMERKWPEEYWPAKDVKADEKAWNKSTEGFLNDREALKKIVIDPNTDFTAQMTHGPKYNIFREILIVGNHNSYHTGQIIVLRRALKIY